MKNKFFQHIFIYIASGGVNKVVPFIVLLILAKFLSTSDFGLLSNFNTVLQLFTALISMKLLSFLQAEYYKRNLKEQQNIVSNLIYLALILIGFLSIVSFLLKDFFHEWLKLEFIWVFLALLIGLGENIFNLRSTIFRLEEQPKKFAWYQFLSTFSAGALTIIFVVIFNWYWEGRVAALFITSILLLVLTFRFFVKSGLFPKKMDVKLIKEFLTFGVPLLPHSLTPFLRMGVDKIVVTASLGLAVNGVYSFAATLASIFTMILSSFFSAYTPLVYKRLSKMELDSNNETKKAELVGQGFLALILFLVVLFVGYWFLKYVIIEFFDVKYSGSVGYLPWFLINVFLLGLYQLFSTYVIFSKKTKLLGTGAFLSAVVQAFLSAYLVNIMGVQGVLYSMLIGGSLRFLLTLYLSNKYYPMPWRSGMNYVFKADFFK